MITTYILLVRTLGDRFAAIYSDWKSGLIMTLIIIFVVALFVLIVASAIHASNNIGFYNPFSEDINVNIHITIEDEEEDDEE